jgi:hypothetical protein
MPKWEYLTIACDHGGFKTGGKILQPKEMDLVLNELGADGWEAVCMIPDGQYQRLLLKRPVGGASQLPGAGGFKPEFVS